MSEGGQLEENQAASPEHTAALRRNVAVRCDASFAEISPPYLPKGWIGFHASGPSERRLETLITSTACRGPLTSGGSILRVAHSFS